MKRHENLRLRVWSFHVIALVLGFLLQNDEATAYSLPSEDNSLESDGCDNICSTPECTAAESVFLNNMDRTVPPCDDFYQFVCGNYIKNTAIPSDKSSIGAISKGQIELEKNLLNDVKKPIDPNELSVFKNLKNHFKNCMNEVLIEQNDITELSKLIEDLGGWPVLLGDNVKEDDLNWRDTVSKISQAHVRNNFPFVLSTNYHPTNSSQFLRYINPGGTMISEKYFATGDNSLKAYETYMIEIAVLLGADRTLAEKMAKDSIEFETKIYRAKTERALFAKIPAASNTHTIEEVIIKYPDIEWLDLLNKMLNPKGVTVDKNDLVQIVDPKYTQEIGAIIKNTSKTVLANYQIWSVIAQLVNYLPKRFREKKSNFEKVTEGVKDVPRREIVCLRIVKKDLAIVLGSLLVRTHFDRSTKNNIGDMVKNIKQQMRNRLENVAWMDDTTRNFALIKIDKMSASIAYPDEMLDDTKFSELYTDLNVEEGSFLKGFINVRYNDELLYMKLLGKSVKEMNWVFEAAVVAEVNAFYNPPKNTMLLFAGILQEPFFLAKRPEYLNYGGIGFVIGHETTHGFDTYGRNFDENGNRKKWWDHQTLVEYEKKAQCLIDQFGNYNVKQINEKTNGKLTEAENIADSGVKLAYNAYNKWVEGHSEGCLPTLKYTPQQMFWINAATLWCSKSTDEALRKQVKEDSHAPDEARINIAFSNIKAFADDFKCAAGSNMNPIKKCEVW